MTLRIDDSMSLAATGDRAKKLPEGVRWTAPRTRLLQLRIEQVHRQRRRAR